MGGCRCIFRDCNVSTTRYPRMHFFHFPVKNQERFLRWVKMAGVEQILEIPLAQQRNRVVCVRHFRDECFMNYKRDRLVATAVPTLMRISQTLALDYEVLNAENMPELCQLAKPTLPHLIAPKGFACPLELDEGSNVIDLRPCGQGTDNINDTKHDAPAVVANPSGADNKRKQCKTLNNVATKRRKVVSKPAPASRTGVTITSSEILNKPKTKFPNMASEPQCKNIVLLSGGNSDNEELYEINMLSSTDAENSVDMELNATDIYVAKPEPVEAEPTVGLTEMVPKEVHTNVCNQLSQERDESREKHLATTVSMTARIEQLETTLQITKQQLASTLEQLQGTCTENEKLIEQHKTLTQEHEQHINKSKQIEQAHETLTKEFKHMEEQHNALQERHTTLQASYKKLEEQQQQVDTVSTSKECLASADNNTKNSGSSTTLSKAQLFNGIKRYLCSSMVSLVRMEMFGNAERQWKPDERRVAVDLLQLGEQVYKYFSDEWRFRLPALRQVRNWLDDTMAIDEEEDL